MLFKSLTTVQEFKQLLFTMFITQPCLKVKVNNLFKNVNKCYLNFWTSFLICKQVIEFLNKVERCTG